MEDVLQQVESLQAKQQANDLNKTKAINQGSTTEQDHPNNQPPVYSTKNIKTGSYIFIIFLHHHALHFLRIQHEPTFCSF